MEEIVVHATCPRCKFEFEAGATKGEGAEEGTRKTHLNDSDREVLEAFIRLGADSLETARLARVVIEEVNRARGAGGLPERSDNSIGGNLSMLQGCGLLNQDRAEVYLEDASTREWKHYRKPVWWLVSLEVVRKALETGRVELPMFEMPVESVPDSLPGDT